MSNNDNFKRAVITVRYTGERIVINSPANLGDLADQHNAEKIEVWYEDSTKKVFEVRPAGYCSNQSSACEPNEKCGCIHLVEIK